MPTIEKLKKAHIEAEDGAVEFVCGLGPKMYADLFETVASMSEDDDPRVATIGLFALCGVGRATVLAVENRGLTLPGLETGND